MTPDPWSPTHRITLPDGSVEFVMLQDGAAYTQAEWDATDTADYARDDAGNWTFQGQPFNGTVEFA
jgi:hypothetical protein